MNRILASFLAFFFLISPAFAAESEVDPILIGEINSYTSLTDYSKDHKNGVDLALEEINAHGGVIGRPLKVISRDDKGDAGEGVRVAQELLDRDHVVVLLGTVFDHVKLAVSNLAVREKVPFFCTSGGTDKFIQPPNPYAVRLDTTMSTMMKIYAQQAAKLPAKSWAIIIPTLEYGTAMAEGFKRELSKLRPDVVFVVEQTYPFGKLDAGASVAALAAAKPDAIFSGVLGSDLSRFVRQGRLRELFKDRTVLAPWMAFQSYIEPLGKEAPVGWIANGMPYYNTGFPAVERFAQRYEAKFGKKPKDSALVGYMGLKSVAAAIQKADSFDREKIAQAAHGLTFETPIGPLMYRAVDGQSNLGIWLGKTGFKDGTPMLVDWTYIEPVAHR
ncbi:MAG TPA: ABC transporter substrate-binding protein [Rhodospirillaceae bacterium]|nr:ABC transporter substrate-binding protein [Rhodospirillaceae bacterium]